MSSRRDLVIVPQATTAGARAAELLRAAKEAASEHTHELLASAAETELLAKEVGAGGEVYPHGIRDAARRFAEQVKTFREHIIAIGSKDA